MTIHPQLAQMVNEAKAKYTAVLPPPTEQEHFLGMLANTVTWEVHRQGRIRIMIERGERLLSVHLPSEFEDSPDFKRVQRALKSLMAVLLKVENPTLTLLAMQAGLTDAITRIEILEDAFTSMMAEAA